MKTKERTVYLASDEYCHVINKMNGKVQLVEGPCRISGIGIINQIMAKEKKIVVKEGQFSVVVNPVDGKKKQSLGSRDIRLGPVSFSLHPREEMEGGVQNIKVLERGIVLPLKALVDFTDGEINRKAGDEWIVPGPCRYFPRKEVFDGRMYSEVSLAEHSGIYVKNKATGDIRLERGKKTIVLQPSEELYSKSYTDSEIKAIFEKNPGFDRTHAQPLWVLENEAVLVMSETSQRVVIGPQVILLEPFERPYIMSISGGTPKGKLSLKVWKIKTGPMFSTDLIEVRTKDNAGLYIRLRYKWRFDFERGKLESELRMFKVPDFIGLATETMASIIRDEAAKHDFEDLHSHATSIIKKAILGVEESSKKVGEKEDGGESEVVKYGTYQFDENGFTIFDIDIKEVTPKDTQIAMQMNDAIKSNMAIYVSKMKLQAEIETEKVKIDASKELEKNRTDLLKIKHENAMKEKEGEIELFTIDVTKRAQAEADAIKVKRKAELNADAEAMKELAVALKGDNAMESYLEMLRIKAMGAISQIIVPSNSTQLIGVDSLLKPAKKQKE